MHPVSSKDPLMMKRATRLGLLLLLLCPIGILAAEAPEDGDRALDLRLLREDIPREVWRPAPSPPADRLPSLGMQPMQPGGREGMPQKGGFRSDLPTVLGTRPGRAPDRARKQARGWSVAVAGWAAVGGDEC